MTDVYKIKPIEWSFNQSNSSWSARIGLFTYKVFPFVYSGGREVYGVSLYAQSSWLMELPREYPTVREAKIAATTHFEEKVVSAIFDNLNEGAGW